MGTKIKKKHLKMLINNNYLSFKVYDRFNKELCLIVVNVDTSEEMYCHVKTTPEMPVRLAVRMSMSFPGTFIRYMVQIYIYSSESDIKRVLII